MRRMPSRSAPPSGRFTAATAFSASNAIKHSFANPGNYVVLLQVKDNQGAVASQGGDDTEGARLIALNMALNGTPREETDRYLSENFELATAPLPGAGDPAAWTPLIPHRADTRLLSVDAFADFLVVYSRRDGLTRLSVLPAAGGAEREIEFAELIYTAGPGSNLEFTQTTNGTYAGSLSGTGSFDKSGEGRLTLTGNSSLFTGATSSMNRAGA